MLKLMKQAEEFRGIVGHQFKFTEAMSVGDGVWQGDLGLSLIAEVPDGMVEITPPDDLCLVLPIEGVKAVDTIGSRHTLDSVDGVRWFQQATRDEYTGPTLVLTKERTVLHPTHGHVVLLAGSIVRTQYQREYDSEQRKERRNCD